jgi:hypothetical protein
MVIDRPREACGYVADGQFVSFDSPVCLLRQLDGLRRRGERLPQAIFLADFRDGSFHPESEITFLLTRHQRTVMDGGVLCFADPAAAREMLQHDDERLTDWNGFRTARGEPDRRLELRISADAMSPDVVTANKGELLLWKLRGQGLGEDLVLAIKGYPEAGAVRVPASGEEVSFRLLTLRPGAGFPVVAVGRDEPLGMLKVAGAHTADEEAM